MEETRLLQEHFHQCMPIFIALGDEVRLSIIEALSGNVPRIRRGLNVNEITEQTNLSRPAISHHLKILKDAGLVDIRREGTANYYYLTIESSTRMLMSLGTQLEQVLLGETAAV